MKDFSEKLKKRLKEIGITQYELCEKIEMTPTGLIHSIKHDTLKVNTLEKICKIIDVSPDYFIEIKPKQSGAIMRMLEDANNEVQRWKMRAFELEEKMSVGNFLGLSRYVNPFFCLHY